MWLFLFLSLQDQRVRAPTQMLYVSAVAGHEERDCTAPSIAYVPEKREILPNEEKRVV